MSCVFGYLFDRPTIVGCAVKACYWFYAVNTLPIKSSKDTTTFTSYSEYMRCLYDFELMKLLLFLYYADRNPEARIIIWYSTLIFVNVTFFLWCAVYADGSIWLDNLKNHQCSPTNGVAAILTSIQVQEISGLFIHQRSTMPACYVITRSYTGNSWHPFKFGIMKRSWPGAYLGTIQRILLLKSWLGTYFYCILMWPCCPLCYTELWHFFCFLGLLLEHSWSNAEQL